MSNVNLFEIATRNQYRFPFKGMISVEDLWGLSVENLDKIFKELNAMRKTCNEESLLNTKSKEDTELENKIEIIKHIVSVKLEEKVARENAKVNREKAQKIMAIKERRAEHALENASDEELDKMLAELGV